MIKLKKISIIEYTELVQKFGYTDLFIPRKPSIRYYKIIRDDAEVAVRCGRHIGNTVFSEQVVINKANKGEAYTIIKEVLNFYIEKTIYINYSSIWTEEVFQIAFRNLSKIYNVNYKKTKNNNYRININIKRN